MQHDGIFKNGQVDAVESVQDLLKNASIEWKIFGNESLPPSVHWFAALVIFSTAKLNFMKIHQCQRQLTIHSWNN